MTTPNNTVAGLPAKWRAEAAAINSRHSLDITELYLRDSLNGCARELEAALAAPAPSAGVVDDAGVLRELIDRYRGQIDNHGECHGDIFTRAEAALQHLAAPSVEEQPNPLARYWMNRSEFWMQKAISLGWREVRDAANGEAPSAPPSVAGDAGERLNEAATEVGHITFESMRQCADSWLAVNSLLHELVPDWTNNDLTGREAALAAIRRLATAEQPDEARCAECDARLELVRPGKHQHPTCGQAEQPGSAVQADAAIDAALEIGWRAGVTCSANVCVQRSDDWNSQDAHPHLIDEAADCRKAIARWLDPTGQTMDELRTMFRFKYVPTHTTPPPAPDAEPFVDGNGVIRSGILPDAPAADPFHGAGVGVDAEWFADVRRCLEDVSTEMRSRGRGDERFQRLIQRMPAAPSGVRVDDAMVERALDAFFDGKASLWKAPSAIISMGAEGNRAAMRAALTAALSANDVSRG